MKLIIAEKKNVAEAISLAFGTGNMKNGFIETNDYIITWAMGHMLEFKEPEEIDSQYKIWDINYLPMPLDSNFEVRPKLYKNKKNCSEEDKKRIKNSQIALDRQLDIIKKYLNDSNITEIIHAGDPDNEGQLLIDELITYFNCKKPIMRVLINDNNPEKIKQSFEKIESNNKYISLGKSAFARAIADRYLGMNGSRFFSIKSGVPIRLGRVKTPVLGLIVNRYKEVTNHIKSSYYNLEVNSLVIKKSNPSEREEYQKIIERYNKEFSNKEKRKELMDRLANEFDRLQENVEIKFNLVPPKEFLENAKIIDKTLLENLIPTINGNYKLNISKDISKKEAPLPFNLIELQQYANTKWGYTGEDVMKITQGLRDNYKAITYNRSDSQYLSLEHYKEAPTVISTILNNLNIVVPNLDYNIVSKCFNDELVTAHHGIIPTNTNIDLTKLTDQERNIYKVIADYYISQFLPPLVSEKTIGEISIHEELLLKNTSSKILDYGYKTYLNEKDDDDLEEKISFLSSLYSGEYDVSLIKSNIIEKETTPKKLYTEATLLKDMTSISKYVKDPILKQALKDKDKGKKGENGGIGTPATRSTTIKDLFLDKYVILKGKSFIPTELGLKIYDYLADEVKTADTTAKWWLIQEEIENGISEPTKLILKVVEDFKALMSKEYIKIDYKEDNEVKTKEQIGVCPKCSGSIFEGKTKDGKTNYYCSNYREKNCNFKMYEEMPHYHNKLKLNKSKVKNLLLNKEVPFKLTNSKNEPYEAYLKLKINGNYVNFERTGYVKKK